MIEIRIAKGLFQQSIGLIFEKKENFNYFLFFDFGKETKNLSRIHSLFVFFPFKASFFDSKFRLVDSVIIMPFTINYTPKKPARFLLEIPIYKKLKQACLKTSF